MITGDFNLIRRLADRNKPEGDTNNMLRFNEAISSLGINEIVLQGRKYTWSNMQQPSPLLEKLDWVFTSPSWETSYPSTTAKALDMTPSDHFPYVISISTAIPKTFVFRFDNNWLKHNDFQQILQQSWQIQPTNSDPAKKYHS